MKKWALLLVAILAASGSVGYAQAIQWTLVNWKVRHDFPSIRRIEPKQLADWLKDAKRQPPLLLDVRLQAEYDVSHLHGAQQVEPDAKADAINVLRDRPIVTYCSVGYRSGAFAKRLQDAGYTNVQNMAGSIFQWANEGRPMENSHGPVQQVHPYNARWARLLNAPLRARVPALETAEGR